MIIQVLKKFFECFSRFNEKLNVDYISESDYYKSKLYDSDSDDEIDYRYSDSDSDDDGVDSDEITNIFGSDSD